MGVSAQRLVTGPGRFFLLALSVALLARAHYVATWKTHGARWSKGVVWISTVLVILLWWLRL